MLKIDIPALDKIHEAARQFITLMGEETIYIFDGKMGAGKTTFIKAICEELGVREAVNSPTFSIVNEYETADGRIIYHFDCYRIKHLQEALELGAEEYLYSGNLCFIEWAENISTLLPETAVKIGIEETGEFSRTVTIAGDKEPDTRS